MYSPYHAGGDEVNSRKKSESHPSSSRVYITMEAVNQQQWWFTEIKGLPAELQEAKFHYFVHIRLWVAISGLSFVLGDFKRLRSTNVRALWSVQNHFLSDWPYQVSTALSICVLYSISSSFPSVGGPLFVSWWGWTCNFVKDLRKNIMIANYGLCRRTLNVFSLKITSKMKSCKWVKSGQVLSAKCT